MRYNYDMEKRIVITNEINEKQQIESYLIFKYKVIDRKLEGKKVTLTIERDDSLPYIEDLRKLEKEYGGYKIGSMLPTIIFPALSILLFTAFLIIFLITKENFNFVVFFCSLVAPALVFLVGGVLFMLLRLKALNDIQNEKPKKDAEYRNKVAELESKK